MRIIEDKPTLYFEYKPYVEKPLQCFHCDGMIDGALGDIEYLRCFRLKDESTEWEINFHEDCFEYFGYMMGFFAERLHEKTEQVEPETWYS